MKRMLVLITVIFQALVVLSQTTFENTYDIQDGENGSKVLCAFDSGYVVAANTQDENGEGDVLLFKISEDGQLVWSKTFDFFDADEVGAFEISSDSSYIIAGFSRTFVSNDIGWIMKVNISGDTIWSHFFNDSLRINGVHQIKETIDSGYILSVQIYNSSTYGDILLVKTDFWGNVSWAKSYPGDISCYENGYFLCQTDDGGFLTAGSKHPNGGSSNVYVLRTNAQGDTLWTKEYLSSTSDRAYSGVLQENGDIVIAGYSRSGNEEDILAMKLNPEGDVIWSRTYPSSEEEFCTAMISGYDGGFLLVGAINEINMYGDAYLLYIDENGEKVWDKKFGNYNDREQARGVSRSNNNGFIISGLANYQIQNISMDSYIIKTDASGCVVDAKITCSELPPYCDGDTIILNTNEDQTNYLWSTGETTSVISPSSAGSYYCQFEDQNGCIRYTDTIVINPIPYIEIQTTGSTCFCMGQSVILEATSGYNSYIWNNGETTPTIEIDTTGSYYVIAIQDGCEGVSDSIEIDVIYPFENQEICMVTVDSITNNNMIIYERAYGQGIDTFKIYKETVQSGIYSEIASIPFDDYGIFVDTFSIPAQVSNRYKISIIDTCSNESGLSQEHNTIHLTSNIGINNEINLLWNPYEGFEYSTFNIYRSSPPNNMNHIGAVPNNTFSFTDLTPPTGQLHYMIEVVAPFGCNPERLEFSSVVSNIVDCIAYGLNDYENLKLMAVSPNPFSSSIIFSYTLTKSGSVKVEVYNHLGRKVADLLNQYQEQGEHQISWNAEKYPSGIYFYKLHAGDQVATGKMILMR